MRPQNPEGDFLRTFNELTRDCRTRDAWNDFVVMASCTLSNVVDKMHYKERESRYLQIIGKYKKQEQQLFPALFAQMVVAMELNPEQDFLGETYTKLGLCDSKRKQVFTPYSVCQMAAEITVGNVVDQVRENGYITINDPCCGAGATLIAGVHAARKRLSEVNINFQHHILVAAQDIDEIVALMCYIQLSLLGVAAYIKVGNTLTNPMASGDSLEDYWFTPMYFSDIWATRRIIGKMRNLFRNEQKEAETDE